jgi:hypothetical protein
MVPVVVSIHDVTNGLAGNELVHFRDDRQRPFLVEGPRPRSRSRGIDGEAVMRPPATATRRRQ